MHKKAITEHLADKLEIPHSHAERYFDAVIQALAHVVSEGESLLLPGFGKLSVEHKPARTARHPKTGEAIAVPAKAVPVFKFSGPLKQRVAEKVKNTSSQTNASKKQ